MEPTKSEREIKLLQWTRECEIEFVPVGGPIESLIKVIISR